MRNIIQRINKAAVIYGFIGVACAVLVGMIGWPYLLSHYGMIAAIVFLGIIIVFSAIAAYGFAAHTHIGIRRGHVDLRVYEREQLSLPLSSLPTTKISQEEPETKVLRRRTIKALPPMRRNILFRRSSPQADQIVDRQPTDRQETTDSKTVSADRQVDADRRKVLLYQQQYPGASLRETAAAVQFGKDKVAAIIQQLKQEGTL